MPLYEYLCSDCDTVFEKIVGFSEEKHSPVCPRCQSQNTRKKISKVAATSASISSSYGSTSSSCGSSGRFR